jgi:hypothetical protein
VKAGAWGDDKCRKLEIFRYYTWIWNREAAVPVSLNGGRSFDGF